MWKDFKKLKQKFTELHEKVFSCSNPYLLGEKTEAQKGCH